MLTITESGAAAKVIRASPPPVVMVALVAAMPWAVREPPPVSTFRMPVRPSSRSDPPPVLTVSGPPMFVALTDPLPESRFAPAIPDTVTGPPSVVAVTVTSDGVMTEKPTLQSEVAHAGAARLRWPPDTDCTTAGGPPREEPDVDGTPAGEALSGPVGTALATAGAPPSCGSYMMVSVISTWRTGPAVTWTEPP